MTLKRLVTALASVALCCLVLQGTSRATSNANSRAFALTTLQKATLKFVTSHKVWKGRDIIKITVDGMTLAPGDELALELIADRIVPIGDPTTGDVLILSGKPGGRLKAKGQLGAWPNTFAQCTATYSPKNGRLVLTCKKGTVIELPIDATVSGAGAFNFPFFMIIRIYVNGAPADLPALFQVKFTNSPVGPLIEDLKLKKGVPVT